VVSARSRPLVNSQSARFCGIAAPPRRTLDLVFGDALSALAVILAIIYIGVFGFAQRLYLIIRDEVEYRRQRGI
jgi:hypothetical protein